MRSLSEARSFALGPSPLPPLQCGRTIASSDQVYSEFSLHFVVTKARPCTTVINPGLQ
jgi:hypothetical protein